MFSVFLRFLWGWRGGLRGPPPPSPPPVPPRPFIADNAASGGGVPTLPYERARLPADSGPLVCATRMGP